MNNAEIRTITEQLNDAWQGDPWFGKPALQLLSGITDAEAYAQPAGQHSVAQLVWHMANWRQFTLSRFGQFAGRELDYFEHNDWRQAAPDTEYNWHEGVKELTQTQSDLLEVLKSLNDAILDQNVAERDYTYRKLLYGIIQHDIYHLGQIAYILKQLRAQ